MDYKELAKQALANAVKPKKSNDTSLISESRIIYSENSLERLHPTLEAELRERKHSLGAHPIFPDEDERYFEEKIMGERFKDVVDNYKQKFDVEHIDQNEALQIQLPLIKDIMAIENKHKKELEALAEKMIRDEFDMSEEDVEIKAELVETISLDGTQKNSSDKLSEMEFDNHDSIKDANDNVYKRRFLNAMTQGAAKKSTHMYHMVDKELKDMDPRLMAKYGKLIAAADYSYFIIPNMDEQVAGGIVTVTLPTEKNSKAIIHAQAIVFPVLIHELVKGVMEILSAHGLPEDEKISEYVINKADYVGAEPWDMRLGPALWERFTKLINPADFNLKHHIYSEIAAMPVNKFNKVMREIMAGTKEGKNLILEMTKRIKKELQEEENKLTMDGIGDSNDSTFTLDDLNNIDPSSLL